MKNWLGISGFDNLIPPKYMVMKASVLCFKTKYFFSFCLKDFYLLSYLFLEYQ